MPAAQIISETISETIDYVTRTFEKGKGKGSHYEYSVRKEHSVNKTKIKWIDLVQNTVSKACREVFKQQYSASRICDFWL